MARDSPIIYVGNLPGDVREKEVDDLFYRYGRIRSIDIKPGFRSGMPAYCFVEFDDAHDASAAVRKMDGYEAFGKRLRVDISRKGLSKESFSRAEPPRGRDRGGYGGGYGGGGGGGYGGGGGGGGGRPRGGFGDSRRTDFRVIITGLPKSCSWQDLKDHMRKGGEVTFAQVMRDGDGLMGLVDYASEDDVRNAIKMLDDSEFRNPYDKCYIRVKEDPDFKKSKRDQSRSRSRSKERYRSRSRSKTKSKSRSRSRSRGRDRDRSRSPEARGRSPSRSRSRTPADDSPRRKDSPARSDRS